MRDTANDVADGVKMSKVQSILEYDIMLDSCIYRSVVMHTCGTDEFPSDIKKIKKPGSNTNLTATARYGQIRSDAAARCRRQTKPRGRDAA